MKRYDKLTSGIYQHADMTCMRSYGKTAAGTSGTGTELLRVACCAKP